MFRGLDLLEKVRKVEAADKRLIEFGHEIWGNEKKDQICHHLRSKGQIIFSEKTQILEPIIALLFVPYSDTNAYNYCQSKNHKKWCPTFHLLSPPFCFGRFTDDAETSQKIGQRPFQSLSRKPQLKKPLPEILLSDSGPTIQLFNLQKY